MANVCFIWWDILFNNYYRVPKKWYTDLIDTLVNSQRIFIISSLAHSLENLR